jgi:DNA-directed RNA polymerase specialized sigma24 family protein
MNRVLVVDDEPAITDGLIALLEIEQIDASGAYSREEAEARIAEEFYPVILADLRLRTEEDGLLLLQAIRERSPDSRVATLTAWATPEMEARLMELGSRRVLRKPMDFDDIIAVVQEMLGQIDVVASQPGAPIDLDALYMQVRPILYAIPQRRYGLTSDEAEELVQQVWMIYLEKQRLVEHPKSWMAGSMANLSKQMIHGKARFRSSSVELSESLAAPEVPRDAVLMVREGLARLDARSRLLCMQLGMEGWSYEEISRETGIPIGSIGPLYIRAKAKLRKLLENPN